MAAATSGPFLSRRWIAELLLIGALGLVIGYLGPLGTFALPLGERLAAWLLLGFAGYALFRPIPIVLPWLSRRIGLSQPIMAALLMLVPSVPVTVIVCWTLTVSDAAHPLDMRRLAQIYGQTWLMGGLTYTLFILAFRGRGPTGPTGIVSVDAIEGADAIAGAALSSDAASTRLSRRLSPGFGPVIALKAEDHYVRVIGPERSVLLLMRLGDAVEEMDDVPGLVVHRSWWVAQAALASVEPRGRGAMLALSNGLAVPVARDRLAALRSRMPRAD